MFSSAQLLDGLLPSVSLNFARLLFVPGVALLFLPKINLFGVASGETAGIRIDDLVLLALGGLLVAGFLYAGRRRFHPVEWAVALFVLAGLVSNALNAYLAGRSSPLYAIRYLEYFVFFYVGYYFAVRHSLAKLAGWIALLNGAAICAQAAGLLGQFTSEGFVAQAARPSGLTGGPWEVGAVLNFCFAILVLDRTNRRSMPFVSGVFASTFALILMTGARMPTLAHLVLLLVCLGSRSRSRLGFTLKVVTVGLAVWACLALFPSRLSERSENLSSSENLEAFAAVYRDADAIKDSVDWPAVPTMADADASWLMRTIKWSAALKTWLASAPNWILGIGPGTLGTALDGGWLRVLTETGLVGVLLFSRLIRRLARLGPEMTGVVLALAVSMVMIDIHIAYKAMSLVFFAGGYYATRQAHHFAMYPPRSESY